jgi:dUTPase
MNQGQAVGMIGAPIQIWGDKADYHVRRHVEKLKMCPHDCGIDLYPSRIIGSQQLNEDQAILSLGTDVHMNTAVGSFLWITSRSSTIDKLSGDLLIDGKIDAGYEGELVVRILTTGFDEAKIQDIIEKELAVAQVVPMLHVIPQFVARVPKGVIVPARGNGGFGSTDIRR